jgi:hypothetical protein
MDRCDSIVSIGSVSGRSVTTADSVIHIANQNWIDSVFFDTIPNTDPPTITVNPSQKDSIVNHSDTVRVVATGPTPFTYTWQFYNGSWSDTTVDNDTLVYKLTDAKNNDSLRCIVSNENGADTSAAISINVVYLQYTVTSTVVGNGASAFLPANDSVGDSLGMVSIYASYNHSEVVFNGFSEDTAGGVRVGDTLTITMHSDRAITLTFTDIPDSSTISITQPAVGSITAFPETLKRQSGDQSAIEFIVPVHYGFSHWTGDISDSTGNPLTFTFPVSGTTEISGVALLDSFPISELIVGEGSISWTPGAGGSSPRTYHYGDQVHVVATPDVGWRFDVWGGGFLIGSNPDTTYTVVDVALIAAHFVPDTVELTLTVIGGGSVLTLPEGKFGLFEYGEACTLVAFRPMIGNDTLHRWSGAATGTADTVFLDMVADREVTCRFYSSDGSATRRRSGLSFGFAPAFGRGWR